MTAQTTLNGKEARCGRVRPRTLVYCYQCEEYVFRREIRSHAEDHGDPPRPRWDNQFAFNTPTDNPT